MPKIKLKNDFEMHYEVVENCMERDTLFIHGNLASNAWFYPSAEIFKSLSKTKSLKGRMIMAEWRGCGQSSAPKSESELAPQTLAGDYIDLCESLQITNANLVAHSTGGIISLLAMAQKPKVFAKAFLLDPVGASGVKFEQAHLDGFASMSQNRDFCQSVMASTILNVDQSSRVFQKIVDDSYHCAPQIWHGIPHVLQNLNVIAEVSKILQPVMIVHGELDPVLPISGSRELTRLLPNAQFYEATGHGHSLNVEDPKMFCELVADFFEKNALSET